MAMHNAILTKKYKVGDILKEGTKQYTVKGVQSLGKGKYLTYFEEKKQSNPSIPKNKWIKAKAIKIVRGKILIKK